MLPLLEFGFADERGKSRILQLPVDRVQAIRIARRISVEIFVLRQAVAAQDEPHRKAISASTRFPTDKSKAEWSKKNTDSQRDCNRQPPANMGFQISERKREIDQIFVAEAVVATYFLVRDFSLYFSSPKSE